MSQVISRIWEPVRRRGSERYLQITILSFAASVSLTRLILEIAGYPQLGNQTYHIAHVLYGGLFLFAGGLLPLIFANRWAYTWDSVLIGVGVGLFIDEVGKFITRTNDYFFPLAAPIIYAFFLMTVLVYVRIRKEPELDARGELYMVLESLSEVLDHNLEKEERNEIRNRLEVIREKTSNPNYVSLSNELIDFIESDALNLQPDKQSVFDKIIDALTGIEKKYLSSTRTKIFLIASLFIVAIPSSCRFINYATYYSDPLLRTEFLQGILSELPEGSGYNIMWAEIFVIMDGLLGVALGFSALLLFAGKNRWGLELGSIALIVNLVGVNFFLFYIQQFSSIVTAAFQYIVLQALYYYEGKWVTYKENFT